MHRGSSSLVFPSLQGKVMIRDTRPYAIKQPMEPKGNAKGKARHQMCGNRCRRILKALFLRLTAIWKRVCNDDGFLFTFEQEGRPTPALNACGKSCALHTFSNDAWGANLTGSHRGAQHGTAGDRRLQRSTSGGNSD